MVDLNVLASANVDEDVCGDVTNWAIIALKVLSYGDEVPLRTSRQCWSAELAFNSVKLGVNVQGPSSNAGTDSPYNALVDSLSVY